MPAPVATICPNCSSKCETEEGGLVQCHECDWVFETDEEGSVTKDDPEGEREWYWEVNDEGELTAEEVTEVRCPRCASTVELTEAGAIAGWCHRCRHTFSPQVRDHAAWMLNTADPWEYEVYDEEEEGDEEGYCPNCGCDGGDGHEVLAAGPDGSLLKCLACGWEWEVSDQYDPRANDENGERRHGPAEREDDWTAGPNPRTVIVSPCGRHDYTSVAEAVWRAGERVHILVRPGLYNEPLRITRQVHVKADGPPGSVVLACRRAPCVENGSKFSVIRGLTIRGLSRMDGGLDDAVTVEHGQLVLEDCSITSDSLSSLHTRAGGQAVLRRCTIHDSEGAGVKVSGWGGVTLEGCEVRSSAGVGVSVVTGTLTMRRCRVHSGGSEGVRIDGDLGRQSVIEDCEIHSNAGPGVVVYGSRALLRRCHLRGNAKGGVRLEDRGQAAIVYCCVEAGAGGGVTVGRGCSLVMEESFVAESGDRGVLLRGDGLLKGCTITGSARANVAVRGGRLALRECHLLNGRAAGLSVRGDSATEIEGCRFSGNAGAGVAILDGGPHRIRRCHFHDNRREGLVIVGNVAGLVERCEAAGNMRAGVVLARGANPTLRGCLVCGHGRSSGIVVRGSAAGQLEGCLVLGNGGAGVEVRTGGRPHLCRCQVRRNGFAGVWVHSRGTAMFEDCDLSGNQFGPMEVEAGSSVCDTSANIAARANGEQSGSDGTPSQVSTSGLYSSGSSKPATQATASRQVVIDGGTRSR